MRTVLVVAIALSPVGCATAWQLTTVEKKVDQLVLASRQTTMTQIFGRQADMIVTKTSELPNEDRIQIATLIRSYQQGHVNLAQARMGVLKVLGGSSRVVARSRGLWIRGHSGQKLRLLPLGAVLEDCRRVIDAAKLPKPLSSKPSLRRVQWGRGEVEGEVVLFPWAFTLSKFTKELVESSARQTAEAFRLFGEGGVGPHPVFIQLTLDKPETPYVQMQAPPKLKSRPKRAGRSERIIISPPKVEQVHVGPAKSRKKSKR